MNSISIIRDSSMTIYPLAGPHYLNFSNQLMAIRSSSGFSHFRPGAFHIALQTHKTIYTIRRVEEKKNKQARTWVSYKHKKGEVCDTFVWFSVHLAIMSMYPSEISTQPPGMLTHLLALTDLASEFTGPKGLSSWCNG